MSVLFHYAPQFVLHSGMKSVWKIDCDALSFGDIHTLARMIRLIVPPFAVVEGVPRGGLLLAKLLSQYCIRPPGPLLIVDDVLTTGESMEQHRAGRIARGVVIFARGPVPSWVTPLFQAADQLIALDEQRHDAH